MNKVTPDQVLRGAVVPALHLLPHEMTSDRADVELMAIGFQETGFKTRLQIGGPARGFWQFERNGVRAVMKHPRSGHHVSALCKALGVPCELEAIYQAIADDDVLAAGIARLMLWADPRALPEIGDEDEAWDCYLRNWNPGKPSRRRWEKAYPDALEVTGHADAAAG